jgi:hypothetical protein
MSRRRAPLTLPPDWEQHETATVNGRQLVPGTEVSIRGERGRFRFLKRVVRPERGIEWLDFWGGPKGAAQWRSFRPDRVRTVHRIQKTPEALLTARRASKAEEAA